VQKIPVTRKSPLWRSLALLVITVLCAPHSVWSADKAGIQQPSLPKAAQTALARYQPGTWNGQWDVTRQHPQITTRGAALALQFDIEHKAGQAAPRVKWSADRGLCESPLESPCEWIGNSGVASSARVVNGHLLVVLQVSADDSDPMVVWLERPQSGRSTPGALISAKGNLAYTLAVERP
jgi:hypothetical protein